MTEPDPAPAAPISPSRPASRLENLIRAGCFVVTAESTPPVSAAPDDVRRRVSPLKGVADAVNITDGAGAKTHMSSLVACSLMLRDRIEPILQFTMRDRNRLALQADLLGAAALGIANILCLRGDSVESGDQPEAKEVYDLDSQALIAIARAMRDEAALPSGRKIAGPPRLFIGAADAPFEPGPDWNSDKLRAKLEAGAQFFQTQFCFDLALLRRYLTRLEADGLLEQARFLVGIGPIRSVKSARWMNDNLWGVRIPEPIIARLAGARDEEEEGIAICAELIGELRGMPGVVGAHLMGPRVEMAAAEAIKRSGIPEERPALTAAG